MLQFPLDLPEPFAATLGVMLYPGESEVRKARAFTSRVLSGSVRLAEEDGYIPSRVTLHRITKDCGEPLDDLEHRRRDGVWLGELFKGYFALSCSHPHLASWESAAQILEKAAGPGGGSRSMFMKAKKRLLTAAHLWGAWSIREGKFEARPDVGYKGWHDFQSFIAEAELLRDWGQVWKQKRAGAPSPLPAEIYTVPQGWRPPVRLDGWPPTGRVPLLELPDQLLEGLRPAGRPRKD